MSNNAADALRAAFPADPDRPAMENYTWRDIDRGSAMVANLLVSLDLPRGARVMVRVDPSVEARVLGLAVLRAGLVFAPADGPDESLEQVIADIAPAVVVCNRARFQWLSRLAFTAGTGHVFTLDADRSGSLLERAAWHGDAQQAVAVEAGDIAAIAGPGSVTHGEWAEAARASGEAAFDSLADPVRWVQARRRSGTDSTG